MLQNPLVRGALSGALGALVVDLKVFMDYLNTQGNAAYNWKLALSRIVQGMVAGVVAALGLGAAS